MEMNTNQKSEKKQSLVSVREGLTSAVYENPNWKGLLYFSRDMILFIASVVGLWNLTEWYYLVPLWAIAGLSISGLFVLGHDAAHGSLFRNQTLSWWVGQLAMLPSMHAYHQWAYGHNRIHHGHTVKLEADFVWHPVSPAEYAKYSLIQKAFHRLYWSVLGAGPYYLIEIWLKGMVLYTAPTKGAGRDKWLMLSFGLISTALVVYFGGFTDGGFSWTAGLWMFTKVQLIPFLIWNYTMGFTIYVQHINVKIPWKFHKDWSPFYGQMLGTINYQVPKWYNFFIHNIYVHVPHHVHMRIPFYHLPLALEQIKSEYGEFVTERTTILSDYIASTKVCKLYDSEKMEWVGYAAAKTLPSDIKENKDKKATESEMEGAFA
jgi:omega-6 fatty acid desaturase (delta-12 desaturase)